MTWRTFGAIGTTTIILGAGGTVVVDKQINPYNDKGTHYELARTSDIPQGERVEIAKDKAQMTLKGWNDEYAITITPIVPTAPSFGATVDAVDQVFDVPASRPLLSKKMEYRSGDVTAFIEPKSDSEFDIDFTLHSKPDTNVFTYKIDGAEEFDFFYQPELTPEEIEEGSDRPENVVGSYAVYHKTKAHHRVGDTNYATGKVYHIYRPKAFDADGAETWAELSYANGALSVTVPQKFMDDAVYPVRVDPTFGYTTAGGTELQGYSSASAAIGQMASQLTASSGDTITSYSVYSRWLGVGGGSAISFSAYTVVSSNPDTRLATITTIAIGDTTAQWRTTATVSQALSNGTTYCIGISAETDSDSGGIWYDAGSAPGRINSTLTTLAASFSPTGTDSGRHYSIYATYTASGGGATPTYNTTYFEIID